MTQPFRCNDKQHEEPFTVNAYAEEEVCCLLDEYLESSFCAGGTTHGNHLPAAVMGRRRIL